MESAVRQGSDTIAPATFTRIVWCGYRSDGSVAWESEEQPVYKVGCFIRDVIGMAVEITKYASFSHWSALSGSSNPVILNAVWNREVTYTPIQKYKVGRKGALCAII